MAASNSNSDKVVRIGGFSAFWGDTATAPAQLVQSDEHLDYLIGDYLAEVTMCILARSKMKARGSAGEGGYVAEFVTKLWIPLMNDILAKGIRIVTNAGGMHPVALKHAIEAACVEAGVECPTIAAVVGDDLTPVSSTLRSDGVFSEFAVENEVQELWPDGTSLMSCNAYMGARPIAEALNQGAMVVVTGRVVDSALVLGPLMHEFGWRDSDYDLLSAGSLAGHIIECGAQCTGGNFTDWKVSSANGWDNVGFPIAEISADGTCLISKPAGTGGVVSFGSVAEQVLYEILDPGAYELPDVCCDWRSVTIANAGKDCVRVAGARGRAPSPFYKVAATAFDGFRAEAALIVPGVDAAEKARAVADAILTKTSGLIEAAGMQPYTDTLVELLGTEHIFGPHSDAGGSREVILRVAVRHPSRAALLIFGSEIAPCATGMAPGLHGAGMGRPRAQPAISYFSSLVPRNRVPASVVVGPNDDTIEVAIAVPPERELPKPLARRRGSDSTVTTPKGPLVLVPLIALCYGRSGDKGDIANVGIIAREPRFYRLLQEVLTEDVVATYLSHLVEGSVTRFDLPGLCAFNFVCTRSLGGGGVVSLRSDRQGKAFAQVLLTLKIRAPLAWVADSPYVGDIAARL